ncbi:MAG: ligase-associated DNA damage response exonuclease [Verrucomicrobiota bacterium]
MSDLEKSWIYPEEHGLYVEPGDFYLDPVKSVARAVITHGHADHARPGNEEVWATPQTIEIMEIRYGKAAVETKHAMPFEQSWSIGPVNISLMPAGHVLGSAQVVLEYEGQRVVYTGDYKRKSDPTCEAFIPVRCDVLITEATFGLPIFRNPDPNQEVQKLIQSMEQQPERSHVIGVYALGKCQRLIAMLREAGYTKPIYLHGSLRALCDYYRGQGIDLGDLQPATISEKELLKGALVLGPPSAIREKWARRLSDPVVGYASGWMSVRQRAKQRNAELPLVISDHADWPDLLRTIDETKCSEVWVTHGQEDALVHVCRQRGLRAKPLALVGFEEEAE